MKGLYVREYKIRKGLLSGKLSADFRCPNKECAATLSCGHDEIGKKDRCPNCGQPFALTKEPLSAFLEQEEQNATERERLKLEKETARIEAKREKNTLAKQRAAEKEQERREKEESAQQMAREIDADAEAARLRKTVPSALQTAREVEAEAEAARVRNASRPWYRTPSYWIAILLPVAFVVTGVFIYKPHGLPEEEVQALFEQAVAQREQELRAGVVDSPEELEVKRIVWEEGSTFIRSYISRNFEDTPTLAGSLMEVFSDRNKITVKLETEDHGTVFVAMGRMQTSNEFGSTTDRAWGCVMKVEGSDRFPVTKCTPIGWGVDY